MKICTKCKLRKRESDFSTRWNSKRLESWCRHCLNHRVRCPVKAGKYQRNYRAKPSNRAKYNSTVKRWKLRNKIKVSAQSKILTATRNGSIIRPLKCSKCGAPCVPHGHHADYSKPLSVEWLCVKCHAKITHRKTNAG